MRLSVGEVGSKVILGSVGSRRMVAVRVGHERVFVPIAELEEAVAKLRRHLSGE